MEDNSFADITFDELYVDGAKRLSNNAFGKAASIVKRIDIYKLFAIKNVPPKYNVWKSLSQFTQISQLIIGLNVTEIPSNSIIPVNRQKSTLKYLTIYNKQNLTIKSNSFSHLNNLSRIYFE